MSSPKVTVAEGNEDTVVFISIERTGSLARSQTVGKMYMFKAIFLGD